jgi:hypothetical protein
VKLLTTLAVCVLLLALVATGCDQDAIRGSGNVVEEQRPVSGFRGVHLAGIGTVTITLGDQEALTIEAEDNLIQYFETEVLDDVLWIGQQDNTNLRPRDPINFYLTATELNSISVSGSGEVQAPPLSAERFSIATSGSGSIAIHNLSANSLEVTVSGSGETKIAGGDVASQDVNISGSGEYDARDMASATAVVHVSGSGEAIVRARDQLEVTSSGSGSLRYAGNPTLTENVTGSGKIQHIGD